MARIRNNHDAPLTVGGVVIAAGRVAEVPRWDIVQNIANARSLLSAGVIEHLPTAAPIEAPKPKRGRQKAETNDDTDD